MYVCIYSVEKTELREKREWRVEGRERCGEVVNGKRRHIPVIKLKN